MKKRKILKIAKWTGVSFLGLFLLISILVYAFRGKIIQYVVSEINQHLDAKVEVQKIDLTFWKTFPHVSVDFKQVLIYDTIQNANDTMFYSDFVRLKFDAMKLWNEEYVLEEAQIFPGVAKLIEYQDGRENYMIFKTKKDSIETSTPIEFKLNAIKLSDFRLSYENKITKQFYSTKIDNLTFKGDFQANQFDLQTTSKLTVLSIKDHEVQLIKNKKADINLQLLIDKNQNLVQIPRSRIEVERLPFDLRARFNDLGMWIEIQGKSLPLQEVVNNFFSDEEDILKYQGKGIATFNLVISDDNVKTTPTIIDCDFSVKNGRLTEPSQNITLTGIQVEGEYSNKKGVGKEYLSLKKFDFQSATGPFNGKFLMTNFSNPHYQGAANGKVNLEALSKLIRVEEIDSIKGLMQSELQFDISTVGSSYRINTLSGDIRLENTSLKLKDDARVFSDINGAVTFNKDEAYVQGFRVRLGKSDLSLNGEFKNLEKFISHEGSISANVELVSNYIDIQDLNIETAGSEQAAPSGGERIYRLPMNVLANVSVSVNKFRYKAHEFVNLRSQLSVSEHLLSFTRMNVENAGNVIQGDLTLRETAPEFLMATASLSSNEINLKRLFNEWNDFEQSMIKEENVSGKAIINMNFKAPFDLRNGIVKKDIVANINLRIVNGALKNVDVFKTIMSSLRQSSAKLVISKKQLDLFGERLTNLQFEVLENSFTISNGKVSIPEMTIKSNALDLDLTGWHTFDNLIDYRFSFRFRDVKTVTKDTEFGIVEDDGTGLYIFMKMIGSLDNPQITWDKEASKQQQKENRENAKKEALSLLKSGFGIGKKDSTIQNYQPPKKKEVVFEVDYGDKKENEKPPENEKSTFQKAIDKKVEEAKKQKQPVVEFDIE